MEQYITARDGAKLFVNDINPQGRKTIVFLHGWPADYHLFEYQYNTLGMANYRMIGIDTRGFGHSERPWGGYDYNTLADDVAAVVEGLHLRNFTLLGHSTGGAIAARYMGRCRGRGVCKLVLAAAAAPLLVKRPGFPYGADPAVIENLINSARSDRPHMLADFGKLFFYQPTSEAFQQWFFSLGAAAAGWATIAIAQGWLNQELFDDLRAVRVPTLILHGVHDRVVPFELGQIQHQLIPCSRLIPFTNSGHGLFYDERERFNRELMDFVD